MRRHHTGMTWHEPSLIKKLWDLTWGLVLVVGLTVISEIGMHIAYTKTPPDTTPVVAHPLTHTVK